MGLSWKKPKYQQDQDYVVHVCDLAKGSDSHLPRLPPNAKAVSRIKRNVQKILLVSQKHAFTRLYLRSQAAIAFEKRRHGISPYWWIIHPCSNFRLVWEKVMIITYTYLFIMIPAMLSFHRLPEGSIKPVEKYTWYLTPGFSICLIDIVLNFFTGYITTNGHEIFLEPSLVLRNYLQTFFIIDLVSSYPYWWIYPVTLEAPTENNDIVLLLLELLPLLKLFRLCRLRKYMEQMIMSYGISQVTEHIIWLILLTTLIFHWAACFTYAVPFFYAYLQDKNISEAAGLLFNTKLYKEPFVIRYLTSLHMGGGNLCSYSFTEFQKTDIPDKLSRSLLLIFGTSFYIYLIVVMLQILGSTAEPELKYQSIMQGVKMYIKSKKLPEPMKLKVLNFFEHRFQGILFKEKAITSTLSKHLKNEIIEHSIRVILESSPIFVNLPRTLLSNIITALKPIIFLQDDIIYKHGVQGKSMYFIVNGSVSVITRIGKEVCHLKDGDYFGESALITYNYKRQTTVIALEVCELLRLDRRDFSRQVHPKSEFFERLAIVAKRRAQIIADIESGNEKTEDDDDKQAHEYVSKYE